MKSKRILLDENFIFALQGFISKKNNDTKYANIITNKKFTIKDTDSTYRIINHWSSLGLFDDSRSAENKGWRKFSIADMTWLKILMELRTFGLPLERIKTGYDSFLNRESMLEFGIFMCMLKKAIYLIVFSDGHIEMADKNAITRSESLGYFNEPSYIVISLNNCLTRIFPEKDFKPNLDTFELSKKEISILYEIRFGNYDEVSIHFKSGELDRIDMKTKHIQEIGKLTDILNKVSYGDFSIKRQNGKITYVEEIKKEKL